MSTSTPIVQLQNISKHYQSGEETVRALDQVSLEIKKRRIPVNFGPIRFWEIDSDECNWLSR